MGATRDNTLIFYVVGAAALAGFAWILLGVRDVERERVHYEDLALARLRNLAQAQQALHAKRGRYGWLDDLEREGLLADFGVGRDEAHPGAAGMYLTSPRYRLDVLLPHTVTRDDHLAISLKSAGKRNDRLEQEHFAVVARPWGDELTGLRIFCLDESGQVYVSEGVSDAVQRRKRPLPELHLTRNGPTITGGMRWYPIDKLPLR